MKLTTLLLAVSICCLTALAGDLTLSDGRVLKDASIVSQTPRAVTIRHAAGLSSVAKTLLPSELQNKYPVDEAAARVFDEKKQQARILARELEQAEYQRSLKLQADREKTAKLNARAPVEEEANRRDRLYTARGEVTMRAEKYFQTEYQLVTTAKNIGLINVTITNLQLIEGWTNRWSVRGKCDIRYNGEVVKVYPIHSKDTIDDVNTPYETTQYSQKTQEFEAIYNAEAAEPTFDITLR